MAKAAGKRKSGKRNETLTPAKLSKNLRFS